MFKGQFIHLSLFQMHKIKLNASLKYKSERKMPNTNPIYLPL